VSVAVAVTVAGPVCTMHCWSIICPVPFPSRLITTHTSTAAAVVNNTMFDDAIVDAVGRAIASTMASSFNSA